LSQALFTQTSWTSLCRKRQWAVFTQARNPSTDSGSTDMSKALGLALYDYPREVGVVVPPSLPFNEFPRTDPDCEFWWSGRGKSNGLLATMEDWSTNGRNAAAADATVNPIFASDHRATIVDVGSHKGLEFTGVNQDGPFPNDDSGQGYYVPSIPQGSPSSVLAIWRPSNAAIINGLVMELGGFSQSPADGVDGASKFLTGGERYFRAGASFYTVSLPANWGLLGQTDIRYVEDNAGGTDIDLYDLVANDVAPLAKTVVFGSYSDPSVGFVDTTMTIGFRSHPSNGDYLYTEGQLLELMVFSGRGKLAAINTYLATYYSDLLP
jgi:hypothetical protein